MGRRGLRRPTGVAPAVVVALAALALALVGAFGSVDRSREDDRVETARDGAEQVARAQRAADVAVARVVNLASGATAPAGAEGAPSSSLIAVARVDSGASRAIDVATGTANELVEAVLDDLSASDLGVARDRNVVRASAPIETEAGTVVAVVAPRYSDATASTTTRRRATHAGFTVGLVDPARIVESTLDGTDLTVSVRDGGTALHEPSSGQSSGGATFEASITLANRAWTIDIRRPYSGTGFAPWGYTLVGVGVAGTIVAYAVRRRWRDQMERLERLAIIKEFELMTSLSHSTHEALDLADLLPAVATRIASHLELDGLAVAIAGDDGNLVEAFRAGASDLAGTPPSAAELNDPPDELAPGQTGVLPLQQHGRTVGALAVRSSQPIPALGMEALKSAAALLGGAIGNARAVEKEREYARGLIELSEMRDEFLGTLSHELRTPLTAIMGFANTLHADGGDLTDEQRRDFIERIARNAATLGSLFHDLLDFSRLERHRLRVDAAPTDLGAQVRDLIEPMSALIDDHPIEVDAPDGIVVMLDRNGLERILTNLLVNAAKFSEAGTPIRVSIADGGENAEVRVDDAGIGVPGDERTKVFRRFYRGRSEEALRTRGTGIGLAVVWEYVEGMNGRVWVDDSPLGGARFVVSLPKSTTPRLEPAAPERGATHEVTT